MRNFLPQLIDRFFPPTTIKQKHGKNAQKVDIFNRSLKKSKKICIFTKKALPLQPNLLNLIIYLYEI